jgi:hypothetical protein
VTFDFCGNQYALYYYIMTKREYGIYNFRTPEIYTLKLTKSGRLTSSNLTVCSLSPCFSLGSSLNPNPNLYRPPRNSAMPTITPLPVRPSQDVECALYVAMAGHGDVELAPRTTAS